MDYKNISIGSLIEERIKELDIDMERLLKFVGISNEQLQRIISDNNVDADTLLRFCKILEYDFFRLYSQHLILFSPVSKKNIQGNNEKNQILPTVRKQLYTKEIIMFILKKYESKSMSVQQIITDYNIPKTTLYRWITKYSKDETKLS
ncbi:MAG: transposase [Myroides sp.]|nr:transposase [Myroides sp.]